MMNLSKDEFRRTFAGCAPPQTTSGKIAERLRRMTVYREAKTILMMPSPLLFQARINCLLDGKILIMPSPALKLGFFRVKPFSIAFPDLAYGTSLKGIPLFGKKMQSKQLQKNDIDLALTGCTALDQKGNRLGEGTGFFDLSLSLLATLGALSEKIRVGCVAGPEQMSQDDVPCDSWDVGVDFVVFKDQEVDFEHQTAKLGVDWDALEKKQIRKIEPLWQLYCELFPAPQAEEVIQTDPVKSPSPWDKATKSKD